MRRNMMASYARVLTAPAQSFFLWGPRGSGKTTWLRERFRAAHWIDLLEEARFQRYLRDAGALGRELDARPAGESVVIDEVQRLPSLLHEVHRQIELRGLTFALTGSSARKLRRSGVNLLGGRALTRTMHPFLPAELGADFDLDDALRFGTVPLVWTAADRDATLAAYVQLYLREEIQHEALVRNLPAFARFLPIAALLHGQVLSVSSLSRDAGAARTTIDDYLSVLEDTLLAARLPAFAARLRVRERAHPKLFWFDAGIVRALRGASGPPTGEERGALFEGWVHGLLRAYRDLGRLPPGELAYWSPARGKTEVDFVLSAGGEHVAIEVKATREPREDHLTGLRAIGGLPGLVRRVLVTSGRGRERAEGGIDILGALEFAQELHEGRLFR
jgi:predicted AAA+ superfamily ATPase